MGRGDALRGARVTLRPLKAADWEEWRDVRIRSRDWLEPWEPLAEPGAPDPITDPEPVPLRRLRHATGHIELL